MLELMKKKRGVAWGNQQDHCHLIIRSATGTLSASADMLESMWEGPRVTELTEEQSWGVQAHWYPYHLLQQSVEHEKQYWMAAG